LLPDCSVANRNSPSTPNVGRVIATIKFKPAISLALEFYAVNRDWSTPVYETSGVKADDIGVSSNKSVFGVIRDVTSNAKVIVVSPRIRLIGANQVDSTACNP
jgi:hypothetical protein